MRYFKVLYFTDGNVENAEYVAAIDHEAASLYVEENFDVGRCTAQALSMDQVDQLNREGIVFLTAKF
jgi:hypothetical protein